MTNQMSTSCLTLIDQLNYSIDRANTSLINNMTEPSMKYEWVCVKSDVTYDYYYQYLKAEWDDILENFINQPPCNDNVSRIKDLANTSGKIANAKLLLQNNKIGTVNIDNLVLDAMANSLMNSNRQHNTNIDFGLDLDLNKSIVSLSNIFVKYCQCQLVDIFKTFIKIYKRKYVGKFKNNTKEEIIEIIRHDYDKFKQWLQKLINTSTGKGPIPYQTDLLDGVSKKLTNLYGFSVEGEIDKLIPDELGSLKAFFVKVISKYYNNLHPIIWAQIFKSMTENIAVEMPFTHDEIFSFASNHLLLNSGPFILKILQMIRPVLSPELAAKYNLTKLTYPLLNTQQLDLILQKVVINWDMYQVLQNFSASVGHVCKVKRVDDPSNVFMIKIIKPLAVAQSCWEYATLYDIYPDGSCEQSFIINMLESNGREFNVNNEITNLKSGYKYYTDNYRDVFGVDIDADLTTVQHMDNIIVPNTWFVLAMTLAPGIPLSKLTEVENNELLMTDNDYRANLHRCLDLLVYKFFLNIVKNGFYHGDLHSGNIFYSYELSQMTLIDFGAVGNLNIYDDDPSVRTLLDVIIMSTFYNYEQILDTMTELLNSKCTNSAINSVIDTNSREYLQLKQKLTHYRMTNVINQKMEGEKSKQYQNDIFGEDRINAEKSVHKPKKDNTVQTNVGKSIYSSLENHPSVATTDTIIESRDVLRPLPEFTKVAQSNSIDFSRVLEEIIKYYALSGVNIAIKFNDLYEFQKAYALLLGVLYKTGYNSYRTGIAIKKAILSWNNVTELRHVGTVRHAVNSYMEQRGIFKEYQKQMAGVIPS